MASKTDSSKLKLKLSASQNSAIEDASVGSRELENGIVLNGVWKDYYDVIIAANENERRTSEIMGFLAEDRDSMAIERQTLIISWNRDVSSLTQVSTKQMKSQQLIKHIRHEKQELETKCRDIESQLRHLEGKHYILNNQYDIASNNIHETSIKVNELERMLSTEKKENETLSELLYGRDESIDCLHNLNRNKDEDINVLKRSIDIKNRQLQVIQKECNRLRDKVETLNKAVERGNRFPLSQRNQLLTTISGKQKSSPTIGGNNDDDTTSRDNTDINSNNVSPMVSPDSINSGETDTSSFSLSFRNEQNCSTIETNKNQLKLVSHHEFKMPYENTDHNELDIKDKIYRSAIRKLQKELKTSHELIQKMETQANEKLRSKRTTLGR